MKAASVSVPPSDGLSVFAALHSQRREERLRRAANESPALLAGRALGLDGALTLEDLVTEAELGALTASPTQLALIRAADGRPVNDALTPERMRFHFGVYDLPAPPPANDVPDRLMHTGERLPSGRPRIVILRTGVRAGKTLISVLALLFSVLTCSFRRVPTPDEAARGVRPSADGMVGVRPGERVRAVIVAPNIELARTPFQHLIGTMQASPKLNALFASEPNKESCIIRRPDGRNVVVKLVAAAPGGANLRSTWLAGALFDEADFHDDEDAAVNLDENLRAARTRMLADAQIWIPSSPNMEGSPFDKMFRAAQKEPLAKGELAFHSDSLSMNPTLPVEEIELERRRDPINAAREYDAIPLAAGGAVFYTEDEILLAFTGGYTPPDDARAEVQRWERGEPNRAFHHTAAADMGFRKNSSALVIVRSEEGIVPMVFRLELRPQKGVPLKPSEVVREFAFWCMRYGVPAMYGDIHYEDTTREELEKLRRALEKPNEADKEQRDWVARVRADPWARDAEVPRYVFWSMDPKHIATAHTEMRRRMQERLIELPNDEHLKKQARSTKKRYLVTGEISVLLPKHGMEHGDVWGATVIACTEAPLAASVQREEEPPPPPVDWRSVGRGFR